MVPQEIEIEVTSMTKFIKKFIAAAACTIASSAMLKAGDDFFVYVSPDPIGVNAFLEMGKVVSKPLQRSMELMCRHTRVLLPLPEEKMLKQH